MEEQALHLHTYFLFPFSVDKDLVMNDHCKIWENREQWVDGVDQWIDAHGQAAGSPVAGKLGRWRRDPYRRFDMDSCAYQDMVFFHPFVRRVFFDTGEGPNSQPGDENLVHCYTIPLTALQETGRRLMLESEDARGRSADVQITDLRMFVFANGIGILSLGVEAEHIPLREALWINEMMRKVYPSSGRQLREGRTPNRTTLRLEGGGDTQILAEERFEKAAMRNYQPPLSKVITELLYFANYNKQEFEPVLDERMIVYTHLAVDPCSVPHDYQASDDYRILLGRLMYVDRWGEGHRYDPDFMRDAMEPFVYRRWAHHGTYYGFTSYSNITLTVGTFDCDEHQLQEGFLIKRMFASRYYLTVIVSLFYRATLLDFSERTALVSRRLFRKYGSLRIEESDIRMVGRLMADFQHFANYWHFSELANKDEEIEHFQLQCSAYRLDAMKAEVEQEIEKLNDYLERVFQLRNTESINRLTMLSLILGAGAMITGFFGMNFGRGFEALFFNPTGTRLPHYLAISAVTTMVVGSILFALYLVLANWRDYRGTLLPKRPSTVLESLRRTMDMPEDED